MQLVAGLMLGVVYAAAPGPIILETLRRGLQGGLKASLAVQVGSSLGLVVYAALALFGARWLAGQPAWQLAVGVCGVGVLVYLGLITIREGHALGQRSALPAARPASARRALTAGAVLSLASPLDFVFWLTVSGRVLHDPALDAAAYLGGFAVGFLATALGVALAAGWWQGCLTRRGALALAWGCGLAFLGFAVQLGYAVGQQLSVT